MNKMQTLQVFRRLFSVSKKYWPAFVIGIVATLLLSTTDAGIAWLIKPIVNKGFIDKDNFFIHYLPILIVIVFLLRSVTGFCSNYFIARVARSVVMDFRQRIFRHLLQLPAQFYDKQATGKLLSTLLYNVEQLAQASSDILVTLLRESSLALGLLGVMFMINWKLSLIFVVIIPLITWGLRISSRRLRHLSSRVQSSVAEVSHIANETVEAYRVVRLFSGEKYETKKFDHATQHNRQQELKVEVTNSMGTAIVQLLISLPLAIILYFATSPALEVNAGSFAAIISAVMMLIRPLRRVTELNNFIQKGITGAESIFHLLDEEQEKETGVQSIVRVRGDIQFQHVNFQYGENERVTLTDINFSIQAGQTVAMVGRSGSGKSTLISLLPRFYEVNSGTIQIDGVHLRDFYLKDLRRQFSLVSQHTVLFNATVAHNIAYAEEEINRERLTRAAELANAMEFIEKLPYGFDTVVGEDGLLLSGGQRQRIAIARALYKQAPILILDEATSALDSHAERQIQAGLAELMRRCTTIVIAHRLSTIENADWIMVMENGFIVEKGTHMELLQKEGVYADLYRAQMQAGEEVLT
ncbi:MAG: lipid A export permease/ATP-binding protein MsbA [Coxiella sp. RIFCSPHIGHO2_12_FULL_42_15]|nr:MAG: lipid A export permease/ATP-binding protein MsbA [Coxiella sp. RIFCSPHIGHO2_12_FULL_42_15]